VVERSTVRIPADTFFLYRLV